MNVTEINYQWNETPEIRKKTTALIIHHAAAVSCTAEDIHRWHLNNGWCGIGYHYFVRKDGSVFRGRPENWVGAHAKNHNSYSIGICFEGNYQTEPAMPDVQLQAGRELIAEVKRRYGDLELKRHKDCNATDCPGQYFPWDALTADNPIESSTGSNAAVVLLKRGSRGEAVKELQKQLIAKGYSVGSCGADGIFGKATETAVRQFQQNNGLSADGIVGNQTKAALQSVTVKAVCPYPMPGGNVKKGSKGDGVRWVQWKLTRRGYSVGSCGADGIFGKATETAVKRFQKDNGLSVDGIVGKNTKAKLQ